MSEYLNTALFGIYPYIALSVLAIGSIIRYDREPYSWKASSSQLLRRRQLVMGSVLFHIGVLYRRQNQRNKSVSADASPLR